MLKYGFLVVDVCAARFSRGLRELGMFAYRFGRRFTKTEDRFNFASRVSAPAVICRACACGASQSGLRWFCRRSLECKVPDHSTFSKNR